MQSEPGEDKFLEWRRKYGDVYTYWMGEHPIVSVNSYAIMAETFQKDADSYVGRCVFPNHDKLIRGASGGVVFVEGELWKDQRRFAVQFLKDMGMGKNRMQEMILTEVVSLQNNVAKHALDGADVFNVVGYLDMAVGSVINALMFGYSFNETEPGEFFKLRDLLSSHMKALGHPLTFAMMKNPQLFGRFPPFKSVYQKVDSTAKALFAFFERQIDAHHVDEGLLDDPKDYVEAFLVEKAKRDAAAEQHFFT
ncbi:CBN-CYP-33C11 protein [Aphelenchoides avenae]|nr:CBN-CYP-33C11 protein [Aphelenchus avenae]